MVFIHSSLVSGDSLASYDSDRSSFPEKVLIRVVRETEIDGYSIFCLSEESVATDAFECDGS